MNKKIEHKCLNNEDLTQKVAAMRTGGKILGNLLRDLKEYVQPGMTGRKLMLGYERRL